MPSLVSLVSPAIIPNIHLLLSSLVISDKVILELYGHWLSDLHTSNGPGMIWLQTIFTSISHSIL